MSYVLEINDDNFNESVLNKKGIVLVEFWADWCGPCKSMMPILDQLSRRYLDEGVSIGKINVDKNQELATRYGIRGIPTLILFKDGEIVESKIGVTSFSDLSSSIQELLN